MLAWASRQKCLVRPYAVAEEKATYRDLVMDEFLTADS